VAKQLFIAASKLASVMGVCPNPKVKINKAGINSIFFILISLD
jgi:hypothetical protein